VCDAVRDLVANVALDYDRDLGSRGALARRVYFEELSAKFPDIEFVKIDVDELEDLAAECGISAMPTFHVYSNGVKVAEMTGADKDKLLALCKDANEL
jgi:thiol-disulfide isomerase/thioredoxin